MKNKINKFVSWLCGEKGAEFPFFKVEEKPRIPEVEMWRCSACGSPTPKKYFVPMTGRCLGCNNEIIAEQEFRWGEERA